MRSRSTRSRNLPEQPPSAARRRRWIDYPRHGRQGLRRWLPSWRLALGTCLLCTGGMMGLFVVAYASVEIPDEKAAARQEATVYYWADGSQMVSVGAVNRQNVSLSEVPPSFQDAVIAAENETFYSDSGVSLKGLARAVVNMVGGQETQGGSTITQQYVKNSYLSQEQTLGRKVQEFFIALKLDNEKSKQDILQGYVNTSWFGRGAYGIQAAAQAYYGVDVQDLNPSQSALLAALLKGSEEYDPGLSRANHERARARWSWILDREVATGRMSSSQRAKYREFPEPLPPSKATGLSGQIGYLVDVANKYLRNRTHLTDQDLARGGYRIYTTFEQDKVRRLEQAVTKVREESLDPKTRPADRHVEVGAASVRPRDGAIVALYGGADATRHFSNNADTSGVPVGSSFKPFVLAAEYENAALGEPYPAREEPYPMGVRLPYPDLRESLDLTANAPFVAAGERVGLQAIRGVAIRSGLREESLARLEPTFPLGTSTPSAIRMAGAYTTFTNGGTRADPYSVVKVLHDGKRLGGLGRPPVRRVMEPYIADNVTAALGVFAAKTLPFEDVRLLGKVAAGGTGPEDHMKSAWFVGDADGLTTAVTMFRTKPGVPQLLPMQGVGGPDSVRGTVFPPRIWAAYANAVSSG